MPASSLTVVSWNVLADSYVKPEWFPYTDPALLDPARRRPRLVQRIVDLASAAESPADVFCLQEVEPEVFASMREALGDFEGRWVGKVGRPDGCALLVRRSLGAASFREMTFHDGTGHVAVAATIDGAAGTTSFATTHLKWQAATVPPLERLGRGELLEVLDGWVTPEERWVVCGDLNAPRDSPVLEAAFARGLLDAYVTMPSASTCNSNAKAKRIDFVLHTKHFTATPSPLPVIDDTTPLPSASEPSDHLAIKAVLVAAGAAIPRADPGS